MKRKGFPLLEISCPPVLSVGRGGGGASPLSVLVGSFLTKLSQTPVPTPYLIRGVFDQLCASIHFSLVMVVTGEKQKSPDSPNLET